MGKKKSARLPTEEFQGFKGTYIIPVMGATGAGKSTFINELLNREEAKVGHDLKSCTSDMQAIDVPSDKIAQYLPQWLPTQTDKQLIIVDTPGFDDTTADDSEILKRIATWLAMAYGAEAKLAGVIYLHEILASRFTGSSKRNFDVFEKLCGRNNCKSVVLGTTKWGLVHPLQLGIMEERQYQLQKVYWKEMTLRGSMVQRVEKTAISAWALVESVLNRDNVHQLRIQTELVDLQLSLPQTDAAKVLREEVKKRIESLRQDGATKEELRAFVDEVAKLKPSFATRLRRWFLFSFL